MKKNAVAPSISTTEYVQRREAVLKGLKGSAAIVFAGDGGDHLIGAWRPNQHFQYLTGITAERGAALLFNPKAEDPTKRCILFLKPLNPEMERWDGYRDEINTKLREQLGFSKIFRTLMLPREITVAARQTRSLACLHPFAMPESPVSPDLALFRKLTERSIGVSITDQTNLLPTLRAATDPAVLGGEYYGPDGFMEQRGTPKRVESTGAAKDPAVAERLWHVSVELTGVPFTALDTPS